MSSPTSSTHLAEKVAAWPRVMATVHPDGTGTLAVNGTQRPCTATSVEELRTGMIARATSLATRLRRPVRLSVTDPAGTWNLAVRPEGIVQLVDDAGTIAPAEDLAPHEGRCRICRRLQQVTATRCAQCGVSEPHRVEAEPVDDRDVVPDAATVQTLTPSPTPPTPTPAARPTLRLTFSTQQPLEISENVALGRNPDPVGGRRPVQVVSHERLLSRTHALIDIDEHGRIVVTDQHSGNGTEAQTTPPTTLPPGTPHVIDPGTTLLMGDVAILVTLT